MNVKGLIVSSGKEEYKTYDCEISIPALKIHLTEETVANLLKVMPNAIYTSIIFMIEGNPVEVSVYKREDNMFYANAREISQMNLTRMPKLKENTLVKKFLDNNSVSNDKKVGITQNINENLSQKPLKDKLNVEKQIAKIHKEAEDKKTEINLDEKKLETTKKIPKKKFYPKKKKNNINYKKKFKYER